MADPNIKAVNEESEEKYPSHEVPEFTEAADTEEKEEKSIDDAVDMIKASKDPFWGNLLRQLYLDGYTVEQIELAFRCAGQAFKYSGQINIWFQDTRPSAADNLTFAHGHGSNPLKKDVDWVKNLIESLFERYCKPDPEPSKENKNEADVSKAQSNSAVEKPNVSE